jgi:hypothetical protein
MPPTTSSDSEDDLDYVPPADGTSSLPRRASTTTDVRATDHDSDSADGRADDTVANAVETAPDTDTAEQQKWGLPCACVVRADEALF